MNASGNQRAIPSPLGGERVGEGMNLRSEA